MAGYAIAKPVSLEDMPNPRVRPASGPVVGPGAGSVATPPAAPARAAAPVSAEIVTSEIDRRERPSIRSFIPENLRNTLGDTFAGIAGADPRSGPVAAFAQAFAGAQGNATAREQREAAATLAADERAYQRGRDEAADARALREDERADRRLTLDEIRAKNEAGGKYVSPDGTDLTPDGYFKVYDLAKSYHSELVKAFGLSSSNYRDPTGKKRRKDIATINAMVADYQERVRQAVLNGKDPASVPKPAPPGGEAMPEVDGGGKKKKGKKGKDTPAPDVPPVSGESAPEAKPGVDAKEDALTPTPAALKFAGSGSLEDPFTGFSTVEQFRAKVPIGSYYIDEDGEISQRLK